MDASIYNSEITVMLAHIAAAMNGWTRYCVRCVTMVKPRYRHKRSTSLYPGKNQKTNSIIYPILSIVKFVYRIHGTSITAIKNGIKTIQNESGRMTGIQW